MHTDTSTDTGKVYSPSQTVLFQRCPIEWLLSRVKGYRTRAVYKNTIAAECGSAFGLAMAHWEQTKRTLTEAQVTEYCLDAYNDNIRAIGESGRDIMATDEVVKYGGYLKKAVGKYMSSEHVIPETWTVTDIEGSVSTHHHAYIDLGGLTDTGRGWFRDYKCKMYCKTEMVQSELQRYENSWQMNHYAHFYPQMVGHTVHFYDIALIVMSPTMRVHRREYEIDPDKVANWYEGAKVIWSRMEAAEQAIQHYTGGLSVPIGDTVRHLYSVLPPAPEHKHGWGWCEYYDACFDHMLEPAAMSDKYIQIDRK